MTTGAAAAAAAAAMATNTAKADGASTALSTSAQPKLAAAPVRKRAATYQKRRSHHRDPRASAHAEDDSHVGEDRDHADHGWSEVFDDAGNPYFHNVRTGETTWDKPDCMKATTHKPLAAKTKSKVPSEEPQV